MQRGGVNELTGKRWFVKFVVRGSQGPVAVHPFRRREGLGPERKPRCAVHGRWFGALGRRQGQSRFGRETSAKGPALADHLAENDGRGGLGTSSRPARGPPRGRMARRALHYDSHGPTSPGPEWIRDAWRTRLPSLEGFVHHCCQRCKVVGTATFKSRVYPRVGHKRCSR